MLLPNRLLILLPIRIIVMYPHANNILQISKRLLPTGSVVMNKNSKLAQFPVEYVVAFSVIWAKPSSVGKSAFDYFIDSNRKRTRFELDLKSI